MKFFLLLLLSIASVRGYSAPSLQGTYEGTAHMYESGQTMNLKFILKYIAGNGNGLLTDIAGSFIIDDEGGPYEFSNVSLDLDTGRIDFRYNRPNRTRVYNTPSHLRFSGNVKLEANQKFSLKGEVVSGIQGPMGTFELQQSSSDIATNVEQKYLGRWNGTGTLSGETRNLSLNLGRGGVNPINPEWMELDYTPSKAGSFYYRTNNFFLTVVYVDYLRGVMYLVNGTNPEAPIVLESKLNGANGSLGGIWNSGYRGLTGTFQMEKLP